MAEESRCEVLASTVAALQRRYGAAAVRRGDEPDGGDLAVWPTGIPTLDAHLTPGGLPRGRLTLLQAADRAASGRLTLLQALAARASQQGEVVYVDVAASLDPGYLADLGADLGACLAVLPGRGRWREGLAMARALVVAGSPWVGVALGREVARDPAADHALTGLLDAIHRRRAVCIVAAPAPPVAPLAYASSLTLLCRAAGWQGSHGDVAGLRVALTVSKSRTGAPGAAGTLLLRYPRPYAPAEVVGYPSISTGNCRPPATLAPAVGAGSGGIESPPLTEERQLTVVRVSA
ncbi:MAG: P-loop NTPase family protein [Candidatus Dormibacteria bacterium]